jgi:hypothetical protein
VPHQALRLRSDVRSWFGPAARALFTDYPRRTVLGVTLMAAQAFCYNAVFFTYAQILKQFYAIPSADIGWFMLPFAAGNFLGPLVLGRLFDTLGRRLMITATYALSGVLMALTGWLFARLADAMQQTLAWTVIFFVVGSGKLRLSDGRRASRWRCARSPSRCSTRSAPEAALPDPGFRRADRHWRAPSILWLSARRRLMLCGRCGRILAVPASGERWRTSRRRCHRRRLIPVPSARIQP